MGQTERIESDICLIVEGSYPYIPGGVSSWAHELIQEHKERTFSIYSIMPPGEKQHLQYALPDNVVGIQTITLQSLVKGSFYSSSYKKVFPILEKAFEELIAGDFETQFDHLSELFTQYRDRLGRRILIESLASWEMIVRLSQKLFSTGPYLDFFWSLIVLGRALYSICVPVFPKARLYHALSTGYAGFVLSLAKKETGAPCILTEHGIYTTERRIEISISEWFKEPESLNLSFDFRMYTMRDFWLHGFLNIARLCYRSADSIITLFEGNRETQISHGADPEKIQVIANGIDFEKYAPCYTTSQNEHPTIALIGRVVPIKDVKTYIRACLHVKEKIPNLRAYLLGPNTEVPEYFAECIELIQELGLEQTIHYSGAVLLTDYLPKIDVNVLTSLSESQPLVILEAGAAGVPSVSTRVGSCPELLEGASFESPPIGPGGIITPLSNPHATAEAIYHLLTDQEFYAHCKANIQKRVKTYYRKESQHIAYRKLYGKLID